MNTKDQHVAEDWQDCPKGSLSEFSGLQSKARTRGVFLKRGGLTALAMLVVVGASLLIPTKSESPVATLSCRGAMVQMVAYFDGSIADADKQSVHEHLKKCPACKRKYERRASDLGMELLVQRIAPTTYVMARVALLGASNVLPIAR